VSLLFVFWIVFKVDWLEVVKNIGKINFVYITCYVFVVLLGIIISSYKWKILAELKGIRMKLVDFFKLYLSGTFINNFMPSFIGGDTYKAYEIGKIEGKYIEGASTVVADRISGLFGAIILAITLNLLNIKNVLESQMLVGANLVVWSFLIFLVSIFAIRKHHLWQKLRKYFPKKILSLITNLAEYNSGSKIIVKIISWSILFNFVGIALANYILFVALGIEIDLLNYLSVIFLISIVASVPISINNIGIKEWAYIAFFGAFGLSASQVVTVAIISRLIQMLISFLALPIYLKRKK
jgi:hypothetical protein